MRILAIAVTLLVTVGRTAAFAWGCDGHQAIAILAERVLGAPALHAVKAVLGASPVDPRLRRGCEGPVPSDIIADAATWADDERAADPATGSWHFVNLPRSLDSRTANPAPYCGGGCVIDAITTQFHILKTSDDRARRANALRFILHLVGDIHQPMHAITNGDRGGNCLPVAYFARAPEEDDRGNFSPHLHGVWDSSVIAALMKAHNLAGARALAGYLARQGALPQVVAARAPTTSSVTSWARDAHALARAVAYGRLPVAVPIEPAAALTLTSCKDNHDVTHRMLALHERLADPYESAAETVIVSQLRLAGIRLAGVLKSAFPSP